MEDRVGVRTERIRPDVRYDEDPRRSDTTGRQGSADVPPLQLAVQGVAARGAKSSTPPVALREMSQHARRPSLNIERPRCTRDFIPETEMPSRDAAST